MAATRSKARAKAFRDAEYPLSARLAEHFDRLARESELELAAQGPAGTEAALQLGRLRSARKQEGDAGKRRSHFFWLAVELHAQFPKKSADEVADDLAQDLRSRFDEGEALSPLSIGLNGDPVSARTIRTYINGARALSRRAGST